MVAGFLIGFIGAFLAGLMIPIGLGWLSQFMDVSLLQSIYIPPLPILGLAGGLVGLLVTRYMTLNQALALGIPILRILSKILRK